MQLSHIGAVLRRYPALRAVLGPVAAARRRLLGDKGAVQRDTLRSLGDVLVGDPVVRIDEFKGVFAVGPRSDLFLRVVIGGGYEPQLAGLCLRYLDPDRDVVDVGANVGFYTVMFARSIAHARVLSIEPTKNAIRRLRRNIEMNGVADKVEIYEGVASNIEGLAEIKTVAGKEEYSSLGAMDYPSIANEDWTLEAVTGATLDRLAEDMALNPGFLKIDVEGAEYQVLQGAERILRDSRPIILAELSDSLLRGSGSSAQDLLEFITAHGYDVFDPARPLGRPGEGGSGNILCFPSEMGVRMDAEADASHGRADPARGLIDGAIGGVDFTVPTTAGDVCRRSMRSPCGLASDSGTLRAPPYRYGQPGGMDSPARFS